MTKVTIYNEFIHEKIYENVKSVYPDGIHSVLKDFLEKSDCSVNLAHFDQKNHGLSEEILSKTDVLVFWSHCKQNEFSDEVSKNIQKHVLSGMGLVALHSAHFSKPVKMLLGTSMTLRWKHDDRQRIFCTAPNHQIAQGIPPFFEIPKEEMYGEYFDIPKPDDVIFTSWFESGEVFRSGCTFTRGNGRIFYFQPGHEEYPVYYQSEIQKIITNAVKWCAKKTFRPEILECTEVKIPLEKKK